MLVFLFDDETALPWPDISEPAVAVYILSLDLPLIAPQIKSTSSQRTFPSIPVNSVNGSPETCVPIYLG